MKAASFLFECFKGSVQAKDTAQRMKHIPVSRLKRAFVGVRCLHPPISVHDSVNETTRLLVHSVATAVAETTTRFIRICHPSPRITTPLRLAGQLPVLLTAGLPSVR
ncbi:hypothetical protein EYF80_016293 [Liparis tanakae]|uniref:Uncharacterized protein n=1 Tax=Liparis tanakae TaxID=230148 RepID=A0A4Z2I8R8_9TELE|nr:hypothetical protein EYF80_016293 [Liparis tanakae]